MKARFGLVDEISDGTIPSVPSNEGLCPRRYIAEVANSTLLALDERHVEVRRPTAVTVGRSRGPERRCWTG
jgi:hypothetical protein